MFDVIFTKNCFSLCFSKQIGVYTHKKIMSTLQAGKVVRVVHG